MSYAPPVNEMTTFLGSSAIAGIRAESLTHPEMAVPLSPENVLRKREAIFKHQSQKDRAMFPGPDAREFWQRAEQRNIHTANQYNLLGLPEFEAVEGFVRYMHLV